MKTKSLAVSTLTTLSLSLSALPAHADPVTSQDIDRLNQRIEKLLDRVDALSHEVDDLKRDNADLRAQRAASEAALHQAIDATHQKEEALSQQVTTIQANAAAPAAAAAAPAAPNPLANLNLWGYGEIYNTNPIHDRALSQTDLARAVFGLGYQFNDKTRFNSEFEVEHAVSSASDVGEFEVEQFYVERALSDDLRAQAGLVLIPTGLLNLNHEPDRYLGVQRNFVETLIIPSTWREAGVTLGGDTTAGLHWNVGLTTAQDISKWNFTPEDVPYRTALELEDNDVAPLQATHQEAALANSQHWGQFVSVDYLGMPGLRVGGSVFTADVGRVLPMQSDDMRATLWEAHARYSPGQWQLSALYAQGLFSNTAQANAFYPGTANPIPARFNGWYLEAGYNLWQEGDYKLTPFARYERYNLGQSYEGLAPGYGPRPTVAYPVADGPGVALFPFGHDNVTTVGANLLIAPGVVLKTDYQHFTVNHDFSRIDFGMGLAFD